MVKDWVLPEMGVSRCFLQKRSKYAFFEHAQAIDLIVSRLDITLPVKKEKLFNIFICKGLRKNTSISFYSISFLLVGCTHWAEGGGGYRNILRGLKEGRGLQNQTKGREGLCPIFTLNRLLLRSTITSLQRPGSSTTR